MKNVRLKRYQKSFDHTYTLGVFTTLALLRQVPENVLGVLLHPKGKDNKGVHQIIAICKEFNIVFEINEKAIDRIGRRGDIFAIGVMRKISQGQALNASANHVILVNPSDMGNLGTIMRTMLGFNVQDLAIIQPAADHYDPKVIRSSMGAIFQVRTAIFDNFLDYQQVCQHNLYPFMVHGENSLPKHDFQPPFGLIFGNESSGLPQSYHSVGTSISIPQSQKIDSLNLAQSVGIALYQSTLGDLP